ncbi:hypothetical protein GDO78_004979 [Eleutherodactylus coqui]|uniref:Uncharacterized protein n=1 Tax=Eleutherodactylus coqui TaxID=57060 RepID=A0A8J6KDA9_ELECQ|nr:hypothetical protein GDO78_004979 [Eleutherodactylus coqui]
MLIRHQPENHSSSPFLCTVRNHGNPHEPAERHSNPLHVCRRSRQSRMTLARLFKCIVGHRDKSHNS